MAVGELAELLVETVVTLAPELEQIPILGRILSIFAPGGGSDIKLLDALEAQRQRTEQKRQTRVKRNARYVLKASDAMKCVSDTLNSPQFLLALGKSLTKILIGPESAADAPDILTGKIFDCIESKVLSQKRPRVKQTVTYYARPSRGHGKGRPKKKVV